MGVASALQILVRLPFSNILPVIPMCVWSAMAIQESCHSRCLLALGQVEDSTGFRDVPHVPQQQVSWRAMWYLEVGIAKRRTPRSCELGHIYCSIHFWTVKTIGYSLVFDFMDHSHMTWQYMNCKKTRIGLILTAARYQLQDAL